MLTQNAKSAAVVGPDGKTLTLADLPSPDIKRWVTRRKAEVVAAVRGELLTREEACERYGISSEEFEGWKLFTTVSALKDYVQHAFKTTVHNP